MLKKTLLIIFFAFASTTLYAEDSKLYKQCNNYSNQEDLNENKPAFYFNVYDKGDTLEFRYTNGTVFITVDDTNHIHRDSHTPGVSGVSHPDGDFYFYQDNDNFMRLQKYKQSGWFGSIGINGQASFVYCFSL